MSELYTRDGKLVKPIGTWEREQLKKMEKTEEVFKPKDGRGRKLVDLKENPMLYIQKSVSSSSGRYWAVRINNKSGASVNKAFFYITYGGEKEALKEAIKFRDLKMKEMGRI
jgi:hypothetical protein